MSRTCSRSSNARRAGLIALPLALAVALPGTATAADGGTTVRAVIGGDGSVRDSSAHAADGSATSFSDALPVTLGITQAAADGGRKFSYTVTNTSTTSRDVTWVDAAGEAQTSKVDLSLPLVAQLGISLPASMSGVKAPGAVITREADGTTRLLWQLVLFSPLGVPTQELSFTAKGDGAPSVQLRATAVDPAEDQGLKPAGGAIAKTVNTDGFWFAFADGGAGGLTQLADGVGKLVDGLGQLADGTQQLSDGLGEAVDGIGKLADGTSKVADGTEALSDGIGKIHGGEKALSDGIGQLAGGTKGLSDGIGQIAGGQASLAGGLGELAGGQAQFSGGLVQLQGGQASLTDGLVQVHGGLVQITDPAAGLPAAVAGLQQIAGGMAAVQQGLGDAGNPQTLIGGAAAIGSGIAGLKTAVSTQIAPALGCASTVITLVAEGAGAAAGTPHPCLGGNPLPPLPGVDDMSKAVLLGWAQTLSQLEGALTTQVVGGLAQLEAGQAGIVAGLSHPAAGADPGGIKEGLAALSSGLTATVAGLGAAVTGLGELRDGTGALATGAGQLRDGIGAAAAGSKQLADGTGAAAAGAKQLADGTAAAFGGSKQLADGAFKTHDGSKQLAAGSGQAWAGSKELASGVRQLSDGQNELAKGMPATVDGSAKIADGLYQTRDGAAQVQDGVGKLNSSAITPLAGQIGKDLDTSRKDLAVLNATVAMASDAPGGEGAVYLLAQDIELASAGSDVVRNAGIGAGALAVLVFALAGGFALGRRSAVLAE